MRLDKYLSDLGLGSRKELKNIIRSGRVSVNGVIATSPDEKVDDSDAVSLDGQNLVYRKYRYFAVDKPDGVLSASEDRKQTTVIDLLPEELQKLGLFPVGRLDKDTTGLLLLTNDGEFAHKVISPKSEIQKLYHAVTDGVVTDADIRKFREGVVLKDGLCCLPAELHRCDDGSCLVSVMEGKYHQVKRMLASVGKPVLQLRRLRIGGLDIGSCQFTNGYCELSQKDLDLIFTEI